MRPRSIILECFKDEETGILGLSLLGMPRDYTTNAASDGLTIAHDLLEHVNGPERIGSIDDELEALGAIWYVRGQHGELRRDGAGSMLTIAENIAGDITRMFRDHIAGGADIDYSLTRRTLPVQHDSDIQDTLTAADANWRGEWYGEPAEQNKAAQHWPQYRAHALALMRTGYRKARRKFERGNRSRYYANNLFWAIAEAVEPYAKHCEYEGAQFELVIDYANAEARCGEHYPEEY